MAQKKRKKIGLALGAGSAKGLAHIGVIRALKEKGVPIDCIAGTSMGAIIGSMYAAGTDLERLPAFFHAVDERRFFDYTTSRKGIVHGNNLEELIRLFTHNMNFEDLSFPFVCVAVDYQRARAHVFDSGPVYKAVRCSISIPGVFEPYPYLGTYFVDGAVLERVPIAACRALKPDVVIGVDVGYAGAAKEEPKGILDTLYGCSDIMSWEITRRQIEQADHMIMPDVAYVNPYSLKESDECIRCGYEEAMRQMDGILEIVK